MAQIAFFFFATVFVVQEHVPHYPRGRLLLKGNYKLTMKVVDHEKLPLYLLDHLLASVLCNPKDGRPSTFSSTSQQLSSLAFAFQRGAQCPTLSTVSDCVRLWQTVADCVTVTGETKLELSCESV
jgi:hypothetical protein